jgi:hypothetical protein
MHVQNEMQNDSQLHTKFRGQWQEHIRYATWEQAFNMMQMQRGAPSRHSHNNCSHLWWQEHSVTIQWTHCGYVKLDYKQLTLLPWRWKQFSFILVNFYHTSWLHIPFSITVHHTNVTSWDLTFHGTMTVTWMTKIFTWFNENFLHGISQNYQSNFKE